MIIKKVGFACKWLNSDGSKTTSNFKTTTVKHLNSLSFDKRHDKLSEIVNFNLSAFDQLLDNVLSLPVNCHMLRISSELLPFYSHEQFNHFYKNDINFSNISRQLEQIGIKARKNNIRLSFHPSQFCVLASLDDRINANTIKELDYHGIVANCMGYKTWHQNGFKINIHLSGKAGKNKFIENFNKLLPITRNLLTVENDEFVSCLDDVLELADHLPIVLDLHHYWIKTGSYFEKSDPRFRKVIDSWSGIRPVIHYSLSKESLFTNQDCLNNKPNLKLLLESRLNKTLLRAHSDYMWHNKVNEYAIDFLELSDIMIEAKAKNLASLNFYNEQQQYFS